MVDLITYGSAEQIAQLRLALPSLENRITAIAPPRWLEGKWKRFGQLLAIATGKSFSSFVMDHKPMQAAIDQKIMTSEYEAIMINLTSMGFFEYKTQAKRILDAHNIEHDIWRRLTTGNDSALRNLWARYEWRKFMPEEIEIFRAQDALLLTSDRDRQLADECAPSVSKHVIPNGVDTEYFAPCGAPKEDKAIVFTGAMNYVPNTEGAIFFLRDIFPRILRREPEAKVYFVGSKPPKRLLDFQGSNVIITGTVPDVRPFVQRAAVYVVPLLSGGGTRFKILEAMSMGRPIVSTTIGCEGIPVEPGRSAIVADDPETFAESTVGLLRDDALRRKLTVHGRELVTSQFDWNIVGRKLLSAFDATLSR